MKNSFNIQAVLLLILLQVAVPGDAPKAQPAVAVSFNLFYNSLAPYGGWIQDPVYGYVWVPDVGPSFRPYYSGGHWVMTTYGNMWVSDYAWGWAPFHYGRWVYDGYYGWVWVPDNVWGPAWVSWRWGGGYCGWAPMGPGITAPMAFNSYAPPYDWWVFVPPTYVYSPVFYRYYEGPGVNATYIHRTSLVSNSYIYEGNAYVAGPRVADIEGATNRRVAVYDVREGSKPSQSGVTGNSVRVFRPEIRRSTSGSRVAPSNVVPSKRSIGKMEAITTNDGRPARFDEAARQERKQQPRTAPERTAPQRKQEPSMERSPSPQRQAPSMERSPAPQKQERSAPRDDRNNRKQHTAVPDNSRTSPTREQQRQMPARQEIQPSMQPERRQQPQQEHRQQQQQRMEQQPPSPIRQPVSDFPDEKRIQMEQRRPQMQPKMQQPPSPQRPTPSQQKQNPHGEQHGGKK